MTGPADILRQLGQAGPPDRELVARFVRQRDQAAFAELVRRHGPVVFGVCRRVTGNSEDAEDAFQAVFLVLARKAGGIGNPDLLGNWLYGVAVRVAQKARRSSARRRAREVAVSPLPDPPARPAPVSGELGPILDEELAALPAWYRDAILLCDLRGVSREEAAALLGVPEGTLSSRLANGRKKLAARLTRRGVALSVAAVPAVVAEAQAGIAVPNELLTRTCGLVADWSAGAPVPDPLAKLAEGGLTVRKTLLFGVMTAAVAVAGAVYAARPGDEQPAKAEAPKPAAAAAKGEPAAEPKPDDKAGEKVTFTNSPKMRGGRDVLLSDVTRVAWSPDGKRLALQGKWTGKTNSATGGNAVVVDATLLDPNGLSTRFSIGKSRNLVGFSGDGNILITEQREYNLVSGFHRLHFTSIDGDAGGGRWGGFGDGGGGPFGRGEEVTKVVDLDATDTHDYAFAADGKSFRTVAYQRDAAGTTTKMEVQEVDAATGKTLKTLLKIGHEEYVLALTGKRLATVDKTGKVTVYDVDRGAKLSSYTLPEQPDVSIAVGAVAADSFPRDSYMTYTAFSPDGCRLVVSRGVGQTVVLNADTGEPLPALEGTDMLRTRPAQHTFTGDGRLLALAGTRYVVRKDISGGKGGKEARTFYSPAGGFLTVWDTQTGKVLKSWDRTATVAFNPVRPLLAVLEKNDEQTRLGLWDFAAEVEKK